jgi:hypothetical protein
MERFAVSAWPLMVAALLCVAIAPAQPASAYPNLIWNTFVGGNDSNDAAFALALDDEGNTHVVGTSDGAWGSPVRPYTSGTAYQDAFAAKIAADGTLSWNTFLGDEHNDYGYGIAVDGSGNVYVAGSSGGSWGNPVRPYDMYWDAFVAKLTPDGVLIWTSFLGGALSDYGRAIAVDGNGNVYVTGSSYATWGSPVRAYTWGEDAFIAKLTADGVLTWNTFLGGVGLNGTGSDSGIAIAVGTANVYVAGFSDATWGSPVRAFTDLGDAFVARVSEDGALSWNTFLGSVSNDTSGGIAVDSSGHIDVSGWSGAAWGTPVRSYGGSGDAFVAQLTPAGALTWNTFLGSSDSDTGRGIALDGGGNIYVAGSSYASWGSPTRPYTAQNDAFAAMLGGDGTLISNAFLGGDATEEGSAIAVDGSGAIYVGGYADANWGSPVRAYTARLDTFVARMVPVACPAAPDTRCRTAQKSSLNLRDHAGVTKDKLTWKWVKGQATTLAELGDPTATADYTLCVYDANGFLLGARAPADAIKWTAFDSQGYKYIDATRTPTGIRRVFVGADATADRAKASVYGRGNNLPDPPLGNLPLPVTAQLYNEQTGICLEGVYDTVDVIKNAPDQFKATAR